ncbi:MAG: VanZ family protein [Deltaproteobacteria bacterium]|nr:VanZ family protein [Deltaproteobacteria bacterium]MBW2152995.1 VanZ family protein [Deltaproteobacteria bacterium]
MWIPIQPTANKTEFQRLFLWTLVAAYTVSLPYIILIYEMLVRTFSKALVETIPLVTIVILALTYIAFGVFAKKDKYHYIALILCLIIIYVIVSFTPVRNTHFHVTEYVILSWMVFKALSIDYRGSGIFTLVFICSSLLGVVDELLQGIHPQRYFLIQDLAVNTASTLVGVISLMGIKRGSRHDWRHGWEWVGLIGRKKKTLGLIFAGFLGAFVMCAYLQKVKIIGAFRGIYPPWLIGWNVAFVALGVFFIRRTGKSVTGVGKLREKAREMLTARLWVLCPLSILVAIHSLVFFVVLPGWEFK